MTVSEHNHSLIIKFSHSVLRRFDSEIQKMVVEQSVVRIILRQIMTALQNINSTIFLVQRDVYNAKIFIK